MFSFFLLGCPFTENAWNGGGYGKIRFGGRGADSDRWCDGFFLELLF